jgi:RecA-family ATPase
VNDTSGSQFLFSLARYLGDALFSASEFAEVACAWPVVFSTLEKAEDTGVGRALARAWGKTGAPRAAEISAIVAKFFDANPTVTAGIEWISPTAWQGSTPAPQEWEVENWIPRHEVTLLYGDGGVGKTLLAHQYATAAATGRKWLGQPTRAARVMCFFCEDDANELHRRQTAINQSLGLAMDDLRNLRLVSRKHDLNIMARWDQKASELKLTALWHQLRDGAQDFGADVIIIDTLADVYAGSEIDRAQVSAFVKLCLGGLAQAIGGSVIALGHPSQSGKNTGSGTSGSTAWSNAARSRIYLKRPEGPQQRGRYAGATPESSGNVRELENMKLNYGPKGSKLKLEWKRGAFMPLGGFSPTSNSGAVETDVPDLDDTAERAVAEAIVARAGIRLAQFPNSPYYAPKVLKTQAAGILKSFSLDETVAAFERLASKSIIRAVEVGRTSDRKPIMGYEIDPVGSEAIDNLSLEDEPCPSAFT